MRARIDPGDDHDPSAIAEMAYDDEFLSTLTAKFKFDARDPTLADELRHIARIYIVDRRLEELDGRPTRVRKSYREFLKVTDAFLIWLKKSYEHPDFYNIATEILFVAGRREPEPQNDFPGLTDHQKRVEAHYRELLRLTELLRATLSRRISLLKPKPGPKPDETLRHFVIGCSEFWTHQLGRKFTIDYHKGAGLTQAYEFVQMLLEPLDNFSEKDIVTAMRAEKSPIRKSKPAKSIK